MCGFMIKLKLMPFLKASAAKDLFISINVTTRKLLWYFNLGCCENLNATWDLHGLLIGQSQ